MATNWNGREFEHEEIICIDLSIICNELTPGFKPSYLSFTTLLHMTYGPHPKIPFINKEELIRKPDQNSTELALSGKGLWLGKLTEKWEEKNYDKINDVQYIRVEEMDMRKLDTTGDGYYYDKLNIEYGYWD